MSANFNNKSANVIDLTAEESAAPAPAAAPTKRPSPLRFVRTRPAQAQVLVPAPSASPAPAEQAQDVKMENSPPATQVLAEEDEEDAPRAKKVRHDDDFEFDRLSGAAFKEIEIEASSGVTCAPGVPHNHVGRAVGLVGNHHELKASLVNAWVGLPVFCSSGYDVPRCNVTFVHSDEFGSTPVACEQTSLFGTFVARRFPDVDNLRAYLRDRELMNRQFNITVHLCFGPESIAAAQSVNGEPLTVVYCGADNETPQTLAPFFAKMHAVLWCHEGPCNSMGVRDLAFSLGLCRPDLYCKCIFVYRQASREPLTPAELPENKEAIAKFVKRYWQPFTSENCNCVDSRWGLKFDTSKARDYQDFCAQGGFLVLCHGEPEASDPAALAELLEISSTFNIFDPRAPAASSADVRLLEVLDSSATPSSPRCAAALLVGRIGSRAACSAISAVDKFCASSESDIATSDDPAAAADALIHDEIVPILISTVLKEMAPATLQLWISLHVGVPAIDLYPLGAEDPSGAITRACSKPESVRGAIEELPLLPMYVRDCLHEFARNSLTRGDLLLGVPAGDVRARAQATIRAHRLIHAAVACVAENILAILHL